MLTKCSDRENLELCFRVAPKSICEHLPRTTTPWLVEFILHPERRICYQDAGAGSENHSCHWVVATCSGVTDGGSEG